MNDTIAIIGCGRMGTALAAALRSVGLPVLGPLGRDADLGASGAVLLCVPDAQIAVAAAAVPVGPLVGHVSGATRLDALAGHEAFALHPLMTVTAAGARFEGAGAAIAGSSDRALAFARQLAERLGMVAFAIDDGERAAYHAAASIASNFLVTLEGAAERLADAAGAPRELLVPLVRATVENWAADGASAALTGPIARGDEPTVARQRAAVGEHAPDLLALFDALADATRALARQGAADHAPAPRPGPTSVPEPAPC